MKGLTHMPLEDPVPADHFYRHLVEGQKDMTRPVNCVFSSCSSDCSLLLLDAIGSVIKNRYLWDRSSTSLYRGKKEVWHVEADYCMLLRKHNVKLKGNRKPNCVR